MPISGVASSPSVIKRNSVKNPTNCLSRWFLKCICNSPETFKQTIPQKLHYIWLGDLPLSADHISNIINIITLNPDYHVTLWTDNPNKRINQLLNAGYSNVLLSRLNIKKPLLPYKVEAAIARECTDAPFKNDAAASDIMRLAILEQQGGVYLDVDIAMEMPLGKIVPQRQSHQCHIDGFFYVGKCSAHNDKAVNVMTSNAVMAACENSMQMQKLLHAALTLYEGRFPLSNHCAMEEIKRYSLKKRLRINDGINAFIWSEKRSSFVQRGALTVAITGSGLIDSKLVSLPEKQKKSGSLLILNALGKDTRPRRNGALA